MITITSNNKDIPVNALEFSDGAITFKVEDLPTKPRYLCITVRASTPVCRVREELALVVDAILGNDEVDFSKTTFKLVLEYTPYARADRRFEKGNPSPLLDFFCFIRDDLAIFDTIYLNDVHNISALPLDLNIIEKCQLQCFKESLSYDFNTRYDIVVSPDKGSRDKSITIANYLKTVICNCDKERDISTGRIIRSVLPFGVDFIGKKILIPDDLCDGGYTFIRLADLLKEAGALQVDLYVTHLIASKGLDKFKGLIDNIYCYQTVGSYVNKQDVNNFNN